MPPRVSLADISRRTGFAISTVSMALRNDPAIPPATRRKIEAAARQAGYHPNSLLASLARRHFKAENSAGTPLASFCPALKNPDDQLLLKNLVKLQQEHGRKLGYHIEAFTTEDFRDGIHATRALYARGVQGIILPSQFKLSSLPGMDWERFCLVGWGESHEETSYIWRPLVHRASVDHFRLVLQAWHEVWQRGYRRIGFVLFKHPEVLIDDKLREGAARSCLQSIPRELRVPPFFLSPPLAAKQTGSLARWVRRHRPDAVLGFNAFVSWALIEEGFRIPQAVGFASLHTGAEFESFPPAGPRDAGMKQMRLKAMLAAVEMLDQQIRHHQYGLPIEPRRILINSEWMNGETLPERTSSIGPAKSA